VTSNDLPRIPAVEPKAAVKTFQVKNGFRIELIASEPNISSPVALSIDERGRMYVVEMIDYSERRDETPHLGRIRILEDTDGDGVYDKSTIFADNLPWPTAVFCYDGGVFVGATPDILYLKDTDGDGKADIREVVFTGFAEGVKRINVQAMLNSFVWGMDNRIHGATSGNGGLIRSLRHPDAKPVDLHGRDFAIEPRSMTMNSEAGGGQHGLSFDDDGRRFVCNNSDHLRLFMYDDRYATRNPNYSMPPPLVSIALDGPAAEVYRISPEEPWRVIRTKWRVSGLVPGPIEGGGRSAGYFTGATGSLIYRGDAFPQEFRGNAFVGDAGGNLVHRKVLVSKGVELEAMRGPGEEMREFAASRDTWFRPVQFANAPDGTLYVIDMYREVIEHPWSLPDNLKKFLDLNSGNNRGRIYRIVPEGFKQPEQSRLDQATTGKLVEMLESPNGWHRDTASRLLYEKQDKTAIPLLAELMQSSNFPLARVHAMHSIDGLGGLTEQHILTALNDSDARVREHAIKLSERFFPNGVPSAKLLARMSELANDPAIMVRYQLAFTLGEIRGDSKLEPLASIARRDFASSWVQAAILSSLKAGSGKLFAIVSADTKLSGSQAGQEFLKQLTKLVGMENKSNEVAQTMAFIAGLDQKPGFSFSLLRALQDGLEGVGKTLPATDGEAQKIFELAGKVAADAGAKESTRVQAVQLLDANSSEEIRNTLLSLLNLNVTQNLQLAAMSALARSRDPQVGQALTNRWGMLTPRLRAEAVTVLLSRPDRALTLLQAIRDGLIRVSALDTTQTRFLRNHADAQVRELAATLLGATRNSPRQEVINAFMPGLEIKGDPVHGKKIYEERCMLCHRLAGEGHNLGPDLVTVKNSGKEKLLVNILDPNREVRPEYVSYIIETKGGESLIGIIANETTSSITLRQPYGKEDVIPRANIKKMLSQGQSLMPESLEAGLDPRDLADLIEFIETADADAK
jgi:putative membrane-bound dehydrogenase-like protein